MTQKTKLKFKNNVQQHINKIKEIMNKNKFNIKSDLEKIQF